MPGKWSFMWGLGLGAGIAGVALASLMQSSDQPAPLESSSALPEHAGDSFDDGYLQAKQAYEEHWQRKICDAIAYIPGVIVAVEVHITYIRSHSEYIVDYDERTVTSESLVRATSGRQRGAEELDCSDSPESDEYGECVEETTRSLVPKHESRITHCAFPPESVHVAVSAPRSYLRRIAATHSSSVDPRAVEQFEASITAQLESTIVLLIPLPPPGEDLYPRVHVQWFDDSP